MAGGWPLGILNGRKEACPRGHAYDAANTVHFGARRYCRVCKLARSMARKRGHPERWREYVAWQERRVFG